MTPSSLYSSTYASVQVKFDLAVRCKAALAQQPSAPVDVAQQLVLAGQQRGGSSAACYRVQQLLADVQFVAGQMNTLQKVRCGRQCFLTLCACAAVAPDLPNLCVEPGMHHLHMLCIIPCTAAVCCCPFTVQQARAFSQPAAPGAAPPPMPFLDWLKQQAAAAANAGGAAADTSDGPAAKRRRISEASGGSQAAAAGR